MSTDVSGPAVRHVAGLSRIGVRLGTASEEYARRAPRMDGAEGCAGNGSLTKALAAYLMEPSVGSRTPAWPLAGDGFVPQPRGRVDRVFVDAAALGMDLEVEVTASGVAEVADRSDLLDGGGGLAVVHADVAHVGVPGGELTGSGGDLDEPGS